MKRKDHLFIKVQTLRDAVRDRALKTEDSPDIWALLGKLDRFENQLCTASSSTLRGDAVKLTLLRIQAHQFGAYQFRRYPSQAWIARYRSWCDDTE